MIANPSPGLPAVMRQPLWIVPVILASLALDARGQSAGDAAAPVRGSEIRGGLLVVLGAQGVESAMAAVRSGPFLAHVLDRDPAAVARARQAIDGQGLYGLVSADRLGPDGKLPYAENLVNLLVIADPSYGKSSLGEAIRVLCPHGVLVAAAEMIGRGDLEAAGWERVRVFSSGRDWIAARKPWPPAMDHWTHPRHGPDGNAVSQDAAVGPPRRVRWVAGPPQEVSNLVTSAGRNFYAGVIARDGFNGLRLWQQSVAPSPARGGFSFHFQAGSVRPIADGQRLFLVTEKRLVALDGATGETLRQYPEAGTPLDLLLADGVLIAMDEGSVRAVDARTGQLRWRYPAGEPRYVVAGEGSVCLIQGRKQRGEKCAAVALDLADGAVRWTRDFAWLAGVRGCVRQGGLLVYEISTLNDDKPGNLIQAVSAADGSPRWNHTFIPGMAHMKQARAMFAGGLLWVLDDRKCEALDPQTGKVQKSYPAGWGHCFPPVATVKYLFSGELNMTDMATGQVDANRITKGACGRDAGFVLANGLIYAAPKHCTCWPMLRDYTALAPARPGGDPLPAAPEAKDFPLEKHLEVAAAEPCRDTDWPCYRHDALRSGSTTARVPAALRVLWQTKLGDWPTGPISEDWRVNSFARGPVTPPVAAGDLVYVARTDAHQVVALDAKTGRPRWTFTADGRIDTPPTIHRGLCLFGTRSGSVYGLRADDGRLAWRLRAAPLDERIVAYGQIESPWPVPGSVLVVDDVAFFAAGRQPLADGGVLVFAVEPATGKTVWVQRVDTVPQTEFYGASGFEFKEFDLMQQEGPAVAMSRWVFDRRTGRMTCDAKNGFARLATGGSGVMAPRGLWSYGPRYESEQVKERPFLEPLVVFRDDTLFGCSQDRKSAYRRDFRLGDGEKFDPEWYAKWAILAEGRKGGDTWRSQRLARGAAWSQQMASWIEPSTAVAAMALTPDALFLAGANGGLAAVSPKDGSLLGRADVPSPVWDGLAAVPGRLFLTTQDGQVVCLAERE
jgi:outer membrane protein assembly factor BamB